jgi:hypothetical protein
LLPDQPVESLKDSFIRVPLLTRRIFGPAKEKIYFSNPVLAEVADTVLGFCAFLS